MKGSVDAADDRIVVSFDAYGQQISIMNVSEYDGLSQSIPGYVMDSASRWGKTGSDGMLREEDLPPNVGGGVTE